MSRFRSNVFKALAGATVIAAATATLTACQSVPTKPPVPLAQKVDLKRFMGDWYVIGVIPTFIEKNVYHAVENYQLREDGRIATTFTFRDGSADAPLKTMRPVGTVVDKTSNAVWTMQFIWPFQADYRISHVDPDYKETIISREKRDYVWIMARTPKIPEADYQRLVAMVAAQGYDISQLRRVPQP